MPMVLGRIMAHFWRDAAILGGRTEMFEFATQPFSLRGRTIQFQLIYSKERWFSRYMLHSGQVVKIHIVMLMFAISQVSAFVLHVARPQ